MGERSVHIAEVAGSIPAPPTALARGNALRASLIWGLALFLWLADSPRAAEAEGEGWQVLLDEGGSFAAAIVDKSAASPHTTPGIAVMCDPSASGEKGRLEIVLARYPPAPRPAAFSFQLTINGQAVSERRVLRLGRAFYGNPIYRFQGRRAAEILERILSVREEGVTVTDGHTPFRVARAGSAMAARLRAVMARCR